MALILGLTLATSTSATARTFLVANTGDTTQFNTLRGAVITANRIGGNNTIYLGEKSSFWSPRSWIYRLTLSGANEDAAQTGDLNITRGNLTIIGLSSNVVIDATGLGDRVFKVSSNAHLTLENLTITGGAAPQAQEGSFYAPTLGAGRGGAILNAGVLTLINCVVTNNSSGAGNYNPGNGGGSSGGDGGAIYNSGTLSATGCTFFGNASGAGFDGASGGNGGAIMNNGNCTLTDTIVYANQSGDGGGPAGNELGFGGYGGDGGGIYNIGTMVLNTCFIRANLAGSGSDGGDPGIGSVFSPGGPGGNGGNGAGLYNAGQLQLTFSSVCDNTNGNGGDGASFGAGGNAGFGGAGAGIFNAGRLAISTATISDNCAGTGGTGGAGFFGGGAVGGAGGAGGGIYNVSWLSLTSCSIALNQTGHGGNAGNGNNFASASDSPGGPGGNGGGIENGAGATIITRNTLVALNLVNAGGHGGTNDNNAGVIVPGSPPSQPTVGEPGADGNGFDVSGVFTSQGFNLIGTADGSTGFTNGVDADQVGTDARPIDPLLAPLAINGGRTPAYALLPGSPAIDKGNSFGVHTDQRGDYRPKDYSSIPNAPGGDGSDIGAFELETP